MKLPRNLTSAESGPSNLKKFKRYKGKQANNITHQTAEPAYWGIGAAIVVELVMEVVGLATGVEGNLCVGWSERSMRGAVLREVESVP